MILASQPEDFERVLDDQTQLFNLERLRQVIVSAGLNRFDRHALRTVGRDHDDERRRLALGRKLAQEVESVLARQVHVQQQNVRRASTDGRACVFYAARLSDVVVAAERAADAVAGRLLVVNDEHTPLFFPAFLRGHLHFHARA